MATLNHEDKLARAPMGRQERSEASTGVLLWIDGTPEAAESHSALLLRTIRYGDGLFATLRIDDGLLLDPARQSERLLAGAETIGLQLPVGFETSERIVERLLCAAGRLGVGPGDSAVIRCQWSAVDHARGYGRSGRSVALVELSPSPEAREVAVRVLDGDAVPPPTIPGVKSCSSLPHVLAALEAARMGADEVIRVYGNWLAEAVSSNLFFERDGRLYTPEDSLPLYPGVVRGRLIEEAAEIGVEVVEGRWTPDDLRTSDAALLTNSVRGVERVAVLEGRTLEATDLSRAVTRAVAEARTAGAVALPGYGA